MTVDESAEVPKRRVLGGLGNIKDYPRLFILVEFGKDALSIALVRLIAELVDRAPQQLAHQFYLWLGGGVSELPNQPPASYLPFDFVRAVATLMSGATLIVIFIVLIKDLSRIIKVKS